MRQLELRIVSGGDTQREQRTAFHVITALNEHYGGQLELLPGFSSREASDASTSAPEVDIALVIVWNEADEGLEGALQHTRAREKLLFKKTAQIALDLSKQAEVLQKLTAKARLDKLLSATQTFKIILFDADDFQDVLGRELRRIADKRLGVSSGPVDLRPQLGSTYLSRPRLLKLLPDTPGHVVCLEAPYGYGKSVLAAQWAEVLGREGWRVLWLAPTADTDLRSLVTGALGVAADLPDALVRERLWETPTLLVAEDLSGDEDLSIIVSDPRGLVLLASRTPLGDKTLLELGVSGRVTRLGAGELAFTLSEAEHLTGDRAVGATLYTQTLGWALPLHVASLTGTSPDARSLLAGIRASLDEAAWVELLFLAALPYLPKAARSPETLRLVSRGFVQALATSYRLHPVIAEVALETYPHEIADTVAQEAGRLPLLLQGKAFERTSDFQRLVGVLEAVHAELWRQEPTKLVRWDRHIKGLMSPKRHWAVGTAYGRLGDFDRAIERLFQALETPGLTPDEQLGVMRELCVPLGVLDNPRGQALIEQAEPLLGAATPELAGRFLGNAAIIYAHAGEPERAIHVAERALTYYPDDSPHRVSVETNLALFRWDLYGDFDYRLNTQLATLTRISEMYAVQALGQCRDLGMFYWWLGDFENAYAYLTRARDGAALNPAIATEAGAALAYLDGDSETVTELARTAQLFSNPYVPDRVLMYKILQELEAGDLAAAQRSYEGSPKESFAACAYARVLAAQGNIAEATALLDSFSTPDRARRLYLMATRYLITRDKRALSEFLTITTAGTRLLPGFIPLAALPDDPALAAYYPIHEVLRSGRKDVVILRETDIPALRLNLLGRVSAELFGEPLELTDRQKHILTLFTLEKTRDEIAEALWPEVETKKQRNNLNVQLNTLRKVIEPWGVTTYLFEHGLNRVTSDYSELDAALKTRDAGTVYALYREPFAPGLELVPIEDERSRLREEVVTLLFEASEGAPGSDAIAYLERILELEPLHEEALQSLLKQLLKRGRRRDAGGRLERFAARLKEELGLEPLEETKRLLSV